MATKEEDLTLENSLNAATNPAHREEDWEAISKFCDQVNGELEGPQYAVRLLAHKIQSPIERESLYALSTLECCVKSCGRRFHQEIGKFRFLNEIIKVISPKYLGSKTTEKVKKKCIELMYCWHKGLPHEPKCTDAYIMLKQQAIVKDDPIYMDEECMALPKPLPEEERRATFEDEEKSKLLAKLLKSKNPDDLQAANRLIKNMVKQDTDRMEKVSRRINELETIHANVKLLSEMVSHYNPHSTTDSEREMMKELYESLEKLRPKLFRLASETDENDTDGLNIILQANDEVSLIMAAYKKTVEGVTQNGQPDNQRDELLKISGTSTGSSLLDIAFDQPPAYSPPGTQPNVFGAPFVPDDEMLSLGFRNPSSPTTQSNTQGGGDSLLSDLQDIFTSAPPVSQQTAGFPVNQFSMGQQINHNAVPMAGIVGAPTASGFSQPVGFSPAPVNMGTLQPQNQLPAAGNQPRPLAPAAGTQSTPQASVFDTKQQQMVVNQSKAMEDLDFLGQSLMQQNLTENTAKFSFESSPKPNTKIPMNQLTSSPANSLPAPISVASQQSQPLVAMTTHPPPVSMVTGSASTTIMGSSPSATQNPVEVQPLTNVFVPLESIKPGTATPVNAYDKNGVKVLIHVAKDRPRDDVAVMVVSVLSTNTAPLKSFVFQAAVPKIMKVKLQPPSATDLPAFNPILPPSAITQVLLLANPQQEKIRLKYKISYILNDQPQTDVGDIDGFSVQ